MTNHQAPWPIDSNGIDDLAFLLQRAGIVLPAGRVPEVVAEYDSFRQQIALVNGAYTAQDEPAVIFVVRPKADPR